jgi:hypothetical protein
MNLSICVTKVVNSYLPTYRSVRELNISVRSYKKVFFSFNVISFGANIFFSQIRGSVYYNK